MARDRPKKLSVTADPPRNLPRISRMTHALTILLALFLAGCSIVGDQGNIEQPPYRVVTSLAENIEVREYPARIAVEATVKTADADAGQNDAFGLLFGYISGANQANTEIAMTAPVETSTAPQKIEMTTPVESRYGAEGTMSMRFFLPSRFTPETAPKPTDPQVQLVFLAEERFAVLTFSGSRSREAVLEREKELRAALAAAGILPGPEVTAFFYDPPWTLPWFRRNEVAIKLSAGG